VASEAADEAFARALARWSRVETMAGASRWWSDATGAGASMRTPSWPWGRSTTTSTLGRPPMFIPWLSTSRQTYAEQVAEVVGLGRRSRARRGLWAGPVKPAKPIGRGMVLHTRQSLALALGAVAQPRPGFTLTAVASETNGVGAATSEALSARLRGVPVVGVHSTQQTKEDAYGLLRCCSASTAWCFPTTRSCCVNWRGWPPGDTPRAARGAGAVDDGRRMPRHGHPPLLPSTRADHRAAGGRRRL
jgi:hypothetical protein